MGSLVDLGAARRMRRLVSFRKHEIRELMNVYSRRVAAGEWRDYAIDHEQGMAVFSIFRSAYETPLFRIAKIAGRHGEEWMVVSGPRRLARSRSMLDALSVFDRDLTSVR